MDPTDTSRFRTKDLADANTDQLIGMSQMAVADGRVTQDEADALQKFLVRASTNPSPLIITLLNRTNEFLADGVLDDDEAKELLELLQSIAGAPGELGEIAKPATLPLCEPAPTIVLQGSSFCFTGTFEFGNRKQCETATKDAGGSAGSLNQKTDYLVIGSYVTDAWKHETFGRKIEKAMGFRDKNGKPYIVSEAHWVTALNQ